MARAQQPERVRRIGVLYSLAEDDPESVMRRAAFERAIKELGWINGGNLRIDYRWTRNDPELIRKFAAELAALAPDVILTSGSVVVEPMIRATQNIPIVFLQVIDPVGSGLIESMAHPGGNSADVTCWPRTCATVRSQLAKADTAFQGASVGQPTESCLAAKCATRAGLLNLRPEPYGLKF